MILYIVFYCDVSIFKAFTEELSEFIFASEIESLKFLHSCLIILEVCFKKQIMVEVWD